MTTAQAVPGTAAEAIGGDRRAWTVTALLVVFMMVNFADKSVLGLAADEIRADLHLSATQFGLANSAFFLLFSVAAIVVGMAADRVSPKLLILVMAVLWSVAQVPAAIGGGLAVLVTSRVFLGAAEGPAFPVAQQATLSWFPNDRRNLPGALITVGITLGVIVSAPTLSWVIQHHGWRTALWVLAVIGVVWALAWAVFGADSPRARRAEATDKASAAKVPYRRIFASRTWIGTTIAYFTSYWTVALMLVWLPSYLRNALDYSADTAGTLVVAPWAVGAAVLFGQVWLTGRLMRRGAGTKAARGRVGAWTLAIGAACCLAVPLSGGVLAQTVLISLGLGFSGAYATVAATTVTEIAPPGRAGGALGLMNAVVTVAGLLAPAAVGALVDAQGDAGYQHAVLLSGGLVALGAVAAFALIDPGRDAARLHH
ncbi:MFS transporter [Streptomyces sp. SID8379]|uniref:MFS transporter n=1 Tax=unclassified Streptomyces TaxID=2593676 RepID=UPI0003779607|nr:MULTISPECIES: MFS transporter [unclassified Streptomyces]MYW68791.1 MFS transporter [Streptomyces sp. SID8379]